MVFGGGAQPFFHPSVFRYKLGTPSSRRWYLTTDTVRGVVNVYKLHGSTTWYVGPDGQARRCTRFRDLPDGADLLMIPPQYRKAQDTVSPPYSDLWSEFRGLLVNDHPHLLNRLVCVGYGMRDHHVNAVLNAALARQDFTLLILARALEDHEFEYWAQRHNVVIATADRCALQGEVGPGVRDVWDFKWTVKELSVHVG